MLTVIDYDPTDNRGTMVNLEQVAAFYREQVESYKRCEANSRAKGSPFELEPRTVESDGVCAVLLFRSKP